MKSQVYREFTKSLKPFEVVDKPYLKFGKLIAGDDSNFVWLFDGSHAYWVQYGAHAKSFESIVAAVNEYASCLLHSLGTDGHGGA